MCEAHGQGLQVQPRHPGFPRAMALTAYFVLSPVSGVFCHRCHAQHRPAGIDATVAAPGPHDFAVRCGRFVRHACTRLTPQRPSQPAPTFRDDREASPFEGTGWEGDSSDLPNCQEQILIGRSCQPGGGSDDIEIARELGAAMNASIGERHPLRDIALRFVDSRRRPAVDLEVAEFSFLPIPQSANPRTPASRCSERARRP